MQKILKFPYHPSEDVLENYAFHRLSEEQIERFEEHLFLCDSCRDALQELDSFILQLREAADEIAPQTAARKLPLLASIRNAAWAGALGATVLAILAISWRPEPSPIPAAVTLIAFRGTQDIAMAHAPSRHPLVLAIEAPDLALTGTYRIEIVNAVGQPAWSSLLTPGGGKLTAAIPARLGSGVYWVRLYASDSELVREFGLNLD